MARIALVSTNLVEADAVGNDVLGMHAALSIRGHEVSLYAELASVKDAKVRPLSDLGRILRDPSAILIYHHAGGWNGLSALLKQAQCRLVTRYHNVTPPEFFEGISHDYVRACRQGREQLSELTQARIDLYLADSEYNRRELVEAGAPAAASAVVAPFHHIDQLAVVTPDGETLTRLRDGKVNVLVVGRIAPNKGHLELLEAFASFRRSHHRDSRLVIVGRPDPRLVVYNEVLRARVATLGLHEAVLFTGRVTQAQLRACYEAADVFGITSQHEGFCVPLVEAMSLGVPVVALGSSAVPETLGEAGIAWDQADPELLAESIHRVVSDATVYHALRERGRRRYEQHFTNRKIESDLLGALGPLLAA